MRGKLSVVNVSCWWMFVTRWTPFFSLDVNLSSLSSPLGVVLLNNVLTWHWNNSEINWVLQDGLIHVLFMYANQCGMGESWLRYHACTKPSIVSIKFAKHEDAVHFGLLKDDVHDSYFQISSAGVLKKDESHLSPVVSILPIVMPGDRSVMCTWRIDFMYCGSNLKLMKKACKMSIHVGHLYCINDQ